MLDVVLLGAAAILVLWAVWTYNRLIRLDNGAGGAWSDIDVQLKRRHDLVGNLVEAVKGYARHERATLEQVVRARDAAEGARDRGLPQRAGSAENALSGQMRQLFAVAEAYPDLKADTAFLELQHGLTDVEDTIQNARRYYNAIVRDLNTTIQSFPAMLVARPTGFREREFFELDDPGEAEAPRFDLEGER